MVMTVLCSGLELEEYGEVLRVGDWIDRLAGRSRGPFYGGELDEVEWALDRYAEVVGTGRAIVRGQVVAIEAIFVRMTRRPEVGWVPIIDSSHREAVASTAQTREIRPEIAWGPVSEPDGRGGVYRTGHPIIREGDERFSGWLIHLDHEEVTTPPEPVSGR